MRDFGAAADEPDVGRTPVKVVFEVGRVDLSLTEAQALLPGAVIPVGRLAGEGLDIVANGQRIGYGTIVNVGGSIGVRVTRLTDLG
jgi:type III secretion protein Q